MKTRISTPPFSRHHLTFFIATAALGLTFLPSCSKEDDALQTQIIETRAVMEQRSKELEQTQAQLSELKEKMQKLSSSSGSSSPVSASGSSDEVARLKARNAELESQLAAARQQAASASGSSDTPPKFDLDAVASKLEDDLTRKAKQLRELVQKQTPGSRVDEISLKAIEYPQQLLATFNSAITFNILAENGQKLRLMFPVTADLGGTWKLPPPAEVQAAYQQAQTQPQGMASTQPEAAPSPAPAASSGSAISSVGGSLAHNAASNAPQTQRATAPAPAPAANSGGSTGMRQVDANTFVFSWGDAPARSGGQPAAQAAPAPRPAAPAPAPAPAPAQNNTPIANFTPPGPGGAAPAAPAPARGGAAPTAPVPAAVMPVQQDITIRFD
ncbi:MAG: hypothetical protein ACAI34_21465 [Verrucomicrobium sp.]